MNRIEFMKQLEVLLANLSADERAEAIQYYNNYFDDAGVENEAHVISELGTPKKVAETIREEAQTAGAQATESSNKVAHQIEEPKTRDNSKLILMIILGIFAVPILIPLAGGLLAALFGLFIALAAVLCSLVIVAASIAVVGIALFIAGCAHLVYFIPMGIALIGTGLIIFVLGLVATVFAGKVCAIIIPSILRGIVDLCRRIFKREAVAS